jgi:hypothetical protein
VLIVVGLPASSEPEGDFSAMATLFLYFGMTDPSYALRPLKNLMQSTL